MSRDSNRVPLVESSRGNHRVASKVKSVSCDVTNFSFQVLETVFSSAAKERKKAAEVSTENPEASAPSTSASASGSLSALASSSLVFDDADYGLHRTHHADVDTTLLVYFFGRKGNGELR